MRASKAVPLSMTTVLYCAFASSRSASSNVSLNFWPLTGRMSATGVPNSARACVPSSTARTTGFGNDAAVVVLPLPRSPIKASITPRSS